MGAVTTFENDGRPGLKGAGIPPRRRPGTIGQVAGTRSAAEARNRTFAHAREPRGVGADGLLENQGGH